MESDFKPPPPQTPEAYGEQKISRLIVSVLARSTSPMTGEHGQKKYPWPAYSQWDAPIPSEEGKGWSKNKDRAGCESCPLERLNSKDYHPVPS